MAQTGYTPILLYSSSTGGNAPAAGNLTNSTFGSELAINITDGKLFYKDNANAIQVIGWKTTPTTAGGTGLTSYTAGDLPYYATGTTLSKLAIGTNGQILTSSGTAPQWTTLSGVAVTTFSAGTTGFTPNSATSGAVTLAGTLATTNGGTGLTAFTANGVFYASSTSAVAQSASLTFSGTTLTAGNYSTGGNLTFTGTGNRITGDMSNTTIANRVAFQTSTINGNTSVICIPNGSATTGQFIASNNSDISNSSIAQIVALVNDVSFRSGITGTGTYLPMTFFTGGVERARIFASGGVSIGNTTDPGATNLSVSGNVVIATSGKGIDFSATAGTGTSELLADYEEGTWTPLLSDGTNTVSLGTARYTKVGRLVTITIDGYNKSMSGLNTANNLKITGNPFTPGFSSLQPWTPSLFVASTSFAVNCSTDGNIYPLRTNNTVDYNLVPLSVFSSPANMSFHFVITYSV